MKVYGFVGSSGTGKSYKAQTLACEKDIDYIIDDGLFIKGTKIIAGKTAKKESTRIAAIKRALFMDKNHKLEVMEALRTESPKNLLIIGTSVSMVQRIVETLNLPPIEEYIFIEDVSSQQEMKIAQRYRRDEGKHVIPVPTFEINKDFSGYFIDPLKIFRVIGKEKRLETLEKTIVRPTFSYFGKYYISDTAIEAIVKYNVTSVEGVNKALQCSIISREDGVFIFIDVSVIYGYKIDKMLEDIQNKVKAEITKLTGLNVLQVNVTAKRLVLPKEKSV